MAVGPGGIETLIYIFLWIKSMLKVYIVSSNGRNKQKRTKSFSKEDRVSTICMKCPQRPEEAIKFPGTGVRDG